MGNKQDKQETNEVVQERELTVNMYVVKDREYEDHLRASVERINSKYQYLISLSLLPTSEECWNTNKKLHVVKSRQVIAKLKTDQISSEFQLLSILSYILCRQLLAVKISCWFKLNTNDLVARTSSSSTLLAVDHIAFGTLENAISFVTASSEEDEEDGYRSTAISYQFEFDERKIYITQNVGEQSFYLEIDYKHMHPIIHIVRREDQLQFDVYFQLRQPPLMYEYLNVDAQGNWRSSRRSYIYGVPSEEIGRCDVLQVCFNTSVQHTDLLDFFSNLAVGNARWEFRFAWIEGRTTNVAAVDETELNSSAARYASKVLESVGLRCQLINFPQLLEGLPENLHEGFLYDVAELYESESQCYLIDVNSIAQRWKPRPKTNRQWSKDSMELRTVFLTPTRVVFRRPSAAIESNRVFREYFKGGRAEYVMKVYFCDEDFVQNGGKNLNFIPLLYWNGVLDDQVHFTLCTWGFVSSVDDNVEGWRMM